MIGRLRRSPVCATRRNQHDSGSWENEHGPERLAGPPPCGDTIPATSVHQPAFVESGMVCHAGQAFDVVFRPAEEPGSNSKFRLRDRQERLRRIHINEAVPNISGTIPKAPHGVAAPPAPSGSVPKRCG